MHDLIQRLIGASPVITDGGWGTELQALGLAVGEFPDLWNLKFPSKVFRVASAYVEAGSRIILTNTFGANRLRLAETGRAADMRAINRLGVQISKEAAKDRARVFASVGPSGKMLLNGDITADEFRTCFADQTEALAEAGADALVIETMSDLEEAVIAVRAARQTGLPVVACMVFDSGKIKDRTMMGNTPEQVAARLAEAGASVIGANCGQGMVTLIEICRRLRTASSLPVWIKPNAGLPELQDGKARYLTTPEEFASFIPALVEAGARFVGGCCGTTPDFVRAANAILRTSDHRCA